jgi:hypothetical protein
MSEATGKALVACPTYAGKEFALKDWIDCYKSYTYEPKHAYMVDNTRVSLGYYNRLKSEGIDVTHLQPWEDWDRTFKRCWQLILKRAQDLDCYWIYSVEADNTPAPESLEIMVNIALYGNIHLVVHSYPMHKTAAKESGIPEDSFMYHELGCMLLSRRLLERAISEFDNYGNIAAAIFQCCSKYEGGMCTLTNRFKVGHLDGFHMEYPNLGGSTVTGLICPAPVLPRDYGKTVPPSLKEG